MKKNLTINRLSLIVDLLSITAVVIFNIIIILIVLPESYSEQVIRIIIQFLSRRTEDNDDPYFVIGLAFIPALLAISYPFIIDIISRLSQLYDDSTHIVEQFYSEKLHVWFLRLLRIAVICTFASIFKYEIPLVISVLSNIVLLYVFFKYSQLLFSYVNGRRLFGLINTRVNLKNKIDSDLSLYEIHALKNELVANWPTIMDLYSYSAKSKDKVLRDDIYDFIYFGYKFIQVKEYKEQGEPQFPNEYLDANYELVSKFINDPQKYSFLGVQSFVGDLLFPVGLFKGTKQFFHPTSLYAMWKNILSMIDAGLNREVLSYWSSAHQFVEFNLKEPVLDYDANFDQTEESLREINLFKIRKNTFMQFHAAICTYVFYKDDIKLLKKLWGYTSSFPPRRPLLMSNVNQIFSLYSHFKSFKIFREGDIPFRYQFGDLDFDDPGDNEDFLYQIRKYACLLFLKLFHEGNFNNNTLSNPEIPENQTSKKSQINELSSFKGIVERLFQNEELLVQLSLDRNISIDKVNKYFESAEESVKNAYNQRLEILSLDKDLVDQFDSYTINKIRETFYDFKRISGATIVKRQRDKSSDHYTFINGARTQVNKDAFIHDNTGAIIDFESKMANEIARRYKEHISLKFNVNSSIRFEIEYNSICKAIEKLRINSNTHVVIAFNLGNYFSQNNECIEWDKNKGDEDFNLNGVSIYSYSGGSSHNYGSVYILGKKDLPMITHKNYSRLRLKEEINKNWRTMKRMDNEDLFLYRNNFENLEDVEVKTENGFDSYYLNINVSFLAYCWFRKNVQMIEIYPSAPYSENKPKNKLSDIKSFSYNFRKAK